MRMSEAEARVAQELAIAKRIETAHEVEMTEYFDYSGQGTSESKLMLRDLVQGREVRAAG